MKDLDLPEPIAAYFDADRHDGQAVTCDDFVAAMETSYKARHPGKDFNVFRQWYSQAGTPTVKVEVEHDAAARRCTVTLSQHNAPVGVEKLAGISQIPPSRMM